MPDSCMEGWVRTDNSCFRYFNNRVNWEAAKHECQNLQGTPSPAYLAIHNSYNEYIILDSFNAVLWLGIARNSAGTFVDIYTGKPSIYTSPYGSKPISFFVMTDGKDCAYIRSKPYPYSADCLELHQYACEYDLGSSSNFGDPSLTSTTTTTTTPLPTTITSTVQNAGTNISILYLSDIIFNFSAFQTPICRGLTI